MEQQTDKQILDQFGAAVMDDIINKAIQQQRNASGEGAANLTREVSDNQLLIIDGVGYLQWGWEYGRGQGGFPPLQAIMDWLVVKGIMEDGAKDLKSVAFLIARKQAQEGSLLFRGGINPSTGIDEQSPSGVITDAINATRLDSLTNVFALKYMNQVADNITKIKTI